MSFFFFNCKLVDINKEIGLKVLPWSYSYSWIVFFFFPNIFCILDTQNLFLFFRLQMFVIFVKQRLTKRSAEGRKKKKLFITEEAKGECFWTLYLCLESLNQQVWNCKLVDINNEIRLKVLPCIFSLKFLFLSQHTLSVLISAFARVWGHVALAPVDAKCNFRGRGRCSDLLTFLAFRSIFCEKDRFPRGNHVFLRMRFFGGNTFCWLRR